jgi:HJR/Mrr/RecB family endonuclease
MGNLLLGVILAGFACYSIYHLYRVATYRRAKMRQTQYFAQTKTIWHMRTLSPTAFEHYVATIYELMGHSVTVTKQSGDGGIDVILKNAEGTAGVQVKRYSSLNVGRPFVQMLVGACANKYDKMIFITSSDFSEEAYIYAAEQGVQLINGAELSAMAKKVFGEEHEHRTFAFSFDHRMKAM